MKWEDAALLRYLTDIFDSVLLKDVIKRNKIRDIDLLEKIVLYLMDTIGNTFSAKTISDFLKNQGRKLSTETVYTYLKALENALLIHKVSRFDIKGKSLERKLFLEQIGTPLGVERYRITEASFIKGCTSSAEVLKRIEKFKQLIDAQPSERWTQFFTSLQRRSTLFAHAEQVLLYTFPDDPEIRRMFATDPALRKLVIRAENNNVVVKKENQKAFQKLLMEHGYLNTL